MNDIDIERQYSDEFYSCSLITDKVIAYYEYKLMDQNIIYIINSSLLLDLKLLQCY